MKKRVCLSYAAMDVVEQLDASSREQRLVAAMRATAAGRIEAGQPPEMYRAADLIRLARTLIDRFDVHCCAEPGRGAGEGTPPAGTVQANCEPGQGEAKSPKA